MTEPVVKLLHTADLHLDSPLKSLALKNEALAEVVATASRAALTRMIDFAIDEGVAALLIAGDLFDGAQRSAKTAAFLARSFDRLAAEDIQVFMIRGNHDAENPAANAFAPPSNVHVFDGRGGKQQLGTQEIWIHGVSFREPQAPESLLPRFGKPVEGAVNIGLLHTSLGGAEGHDTYAPCSVSDLVAHGFDYWALGHIHSRTVHHEDPWVVMPGMPQGRDMGETGAKSAALISIAGGTVTDVTEVPTAIAEFRRSTCDITEAEDDEAIRHALCAHLQAEADALRAQTGILRPTLQATPAQTWALTRDAAFWREVAEGLAEDTGRLWIESLDTTEAGMQGPDEVGAIGELAALIDALRGEDGFRKDAQELLAQTLAQLPARRAALAPDAAAETALADRLAEAGARALVARMRGMQ